jgi:hypothetical protein
MLFGETVAVYCENHTEHTDTVRTVRTSQETHYVPTTEPNRLMLFGGNNRCLFWKPYGTHRYSPHLTKNTLRLSYRAQPVNAVWGTVAVYCKNHTEHKWMRAPSSSPLSILDWIFLIIFGVGSKQMNSPSFCFLKSPLTLISFKVSHLSRFKTRGNTSARLWDPWTPLFNGYSRRFSRGWNFQTVTFANENETRTFFFQTSPPQYVAMASEVKRLYLC